MAIDRKATSLHVFDLTGGVDFEIPIENEGRRELANAYIAANAGAADGQTWNSGAGFRFRPPNQCFFQLRSTLDAFLKKLS